MIFGVSPYGVEPYGAGLLALPAAPTVLLQDLYALLNPLAIGGAHYGVNTAEPPTYPYITFQRVVSTPNVTLDGPSDLQSTRVQVDIFSRQISQAAAIEVTLEAAFANWSLWGNVPLSSLDLYEDAVKAYRISKDWSVWSTN